MSIVNFFYKGEKYKIERSLLNKYTDYFSKSNLQENETVNLVTDFDLNYEEEISKDTINEFYGFFEKEGNIKLTKSNVFPIKKLSTKYAIITLTALTDEYIKQHTKELINYILTDKIQIGYEEECFILTNLQDILDNDLLLTLPISQLYRIIYRYFKKATELSKEDEIKIINFYIKVVQKKGKEGSILFPLFKSSTEVRRYFNQEILKNLESIDSSSIISNLIRSLIDLEEEKKEMNLKFNNEISFLIKQRDQLEKKIKDMKQNYEATEQKVNQLSSTFLAQMEKLKNEMKEEVKLQQKQKDDQVEHLKKSLIESSPFYESKKCDDFNKLNGVIQEMIIFNLKSKIPENQMIQKVSDLLSYLSKEQYKSNYKIDKVQYIQIKMKKGKENLFTDFDSIKKITLSASAIDMLIENCSLKSSEFDNVFKTIDNICIEIPLTNKTIDQINHYFSRFAIITIPKSVTDIKPNSFQNFSSLIEIKIPSSVTSIGSNSFVNCSSLKRIKISSSVKLIGECCFSKCTNLEEIEIDPYKTKLEKNVFDECPSLKHLIISSTVTIIDELNYDIYNKFTKITIPNSVTDIKPYSFQNFSSLIEITIPSSVRSIGSNSVENCSSLTSITAQSSVRSIGSNAFENCSSLKRITIPSSVTSIGECCFSKCTSLEEIEIDPYKTKLEKNIFNECPSLKHLIISSTVAIIGKLNYDIYNKFTKITIPNSVTMIKPNSFQNFSSLIEITIPSSVRSIGSNSFENCSLLKRITISSSVSSIEPNLFKNCRSLIEITIPSSVTSIGSNSFENCSSLTSITIPSSVTSIGSNAFENCSSLTSITIPSSVTSIGLNLFKNCISLTEIIISSSIEPSHYIHNSRINYLSSRLQHLYPSIKIIKL